MTLLECGDHGRDDEQEAGDIRVVHESKEPGNRKEREDDGIRRRGEEVVRRTFAFMVRDEARDGKRKCEKTEEGGQSEDCNIAFENEDAIDDLAEQVSETGWWST